MRGPINLKTPRPTLHWGLFILCGVVFLFVLPGILSEFQLNLLGRFLTYAIVALGLDLIWGYTGMLSLGQGLFFGLGAYCFAMYLKLEQSGGKMPNFMELFGVTELPTLWQPFNSPVFALVAAIGIPVLIASVIGYLVFRSRIQGVYFSIITQALTLIVSLLLIGQGPLINGTNGLTDFSTMFGLKLSDHSTKLVLYIATVICLGLVYLLCRLVVQSRFGRLLVALRDDETRMRYTGYNPAMLKLFVFALSAGIAGLAGILFVPQVGIISPAALGIVPSIEIVIWVAVGGRASLVGAIIGALLVNVGKSTISTSYPDIWQLIMGALFVGAVLMFPTGIVGAINKRLSALWSRFGSGRSVESPPLLESRGEAEAASY